MSASPRLDTGDMLISPLAGNVCFASARYRFHSNITFPTILTSQLIHPFYHKYPSLLEKLKYNKISPRFCFTIQSFADLYASHYGGFPANKLAERLWGDIYFNRDSRTFSKKSTEGANRSFVDFVLEPLYKLMAQVNFMRSESI